MYLISPRARKEIAAATEYVYKTTNDRHAAAAFVESLLAGFDLIASMPRLGRPRPAYGRGLRSYLIGNYTIFYWPRAPDVEIARVLHQRSDLRRAFSRFRRRKIQLTPEFEDAVSERVDSGAYASTDQVLVACVRGLERIEAEDW